MKEEVFYSCGKWHDGEVSGCDLASGRRKKKGKERRMKEKEERK